VRIGLFIASVMVSAVCLAQRPADYPLFDEVEELSASRILPADLLQGEHYTVDDRVVNDGYLNYFTIQSDYGEFDAVGTPMLRIRIKEIGALAELEEFSQSEVFVKAAAEAGRNQIVVIGNLATRPVSTIAGLPKGIGRMFGRYKRQTGDAVSDTRDYVSEQSEDSDASEEDEAARMEKAVSLTERYFGVTAAERNWAQRLGTDPYTSNETLREAIKRVAWADRLGRTAMRFTGMAIPYAGIASTVNEAVWGEDPYALQDLNRSRLVATGASEELVDAFVRNPWLSPTQQTIVTAVLAELDGVAGRDGILTQALNPQSEEEVGFFVRSLVLLGWYHMHRTPITAVDTQLAIPAGITDSGTIVFLLATDHVYWTETHAEEAHTFALLGSETDNRRREIWFLRTISDRTRQGLDELGVIVHTDTADEITPEALDSP